MGQRTPFPAVYFDEITDVSICEDLVRVTAIAGKHTLHCVLTQSDAEQAHRMLGAALSRTKSKGHIRAA